MSRALAGLLEKLRAPPFLPLAVSAGLVWSPLERVLQLLPTAQMHLKLLQMMHQ